MHWSAPPKAQWFQSNARKHVRRISRMMPIGSRPPFMRVQYADRGSMSHSRPSIASG